jgi:hypothetical protein
MGFVDFLIFNVAGVVLASSLSLALVMGFWQGFAGVVLPSALALALVMRLTSLDLSTAAGKSGNKIRVTN